MRGPRRLERRLFGWLFAASLLPAALVLVLAVWAGGRALDLTGTLGPWEQVAASGRVLFERLDEQEGDLPAGVQDAAAQHRQRVSESLLFARRWSYLGERAARALPIFLLVTVLLLAALALLASRSIARTFTRPIQELVGWAESLGREESLPPPGSAERRDVLEVAVLRGALRHAAMEREESRRRALEAERTRVWGELARRIAHEMKNPLTPLRLAAHRLARNEGAMPALDEAVTVIENETRRLEELAAEFSELGRPPEGPPSLIDVGELLRGIIATDVPDGVSVRADLDAPAMVEAHYEPLLRAFRNLIRNAVEAMTDHATRRLEVRLRGGADSVEVTISDSGRGLPSGAGERIFEPDFTTKSGGTGLGLTLARQTILAAGGNISAATRAGGGAELRIRLPVGGGAA